MAQFTLGVDHIVSEWKADMTRRILGDVLLTVVSAFLVLLFTIASVWCALALLVILPLGGWFIADAVRNYRRKMAVWQALPDDTRRKINALCADERQKAYSRLLRGYLTPYGMLLREGFIPWEGIVSVNFREQGREVSRWTVWMNRISWLIDLISVFNGNGGVGTEYFDPESPAQCRIRVNRGGEKEKITEYRIPLDPQSFAGDGVDSLIAEMRACSPVELKIF